MLVQQSGHLTAHPPAKTLTNLTKVTQQLASATFKLRSTETPKAFSSNPTTKNQNEALPRTSQHPRAGDNAGSSAGVVPGRP